MEKKFSQNEKMYSLYWLFIRLLIDLLMLQFWRWVQLGICTHRKQSVIISTRLFCLYYLLDTIGRYIRLIIIHIQNALGIMSCGRSHFWTMHNKLRCWTWKQKKKPNTTFIKTIAFVYFQLFFLSFNSFWMLSNAFQQIPWSYAFFIKQWFPQVFQLQTLESFLTKLMRSFWLQWSVSWWESKKNTFA